MIILLTHFAHQTKAENWYVDNAATSGTNNGASWSNAWQSFSAIKWNNVNQEDTLNISGGIDSTIYKETLSIGKNGSSNYFLIQTGQNPPHNGKVIIDGGSATRNSGISISDKSYIKISGHVGNGNDCKMQIRNHKSDGINVSGKLTHIILEFLEVNNNGTVDNSHGITIQTTMNTNSSFEICHCKIHDNFEDAIHAAQSTSGEGTQFGTVKIHDNDIYNIVDDGIETSYPCTINNNLIRSRILGKGVGHPDGIQFYNSYTQIYNNTIYDMVRTDDISANSAIFSDAFDKDITLNPHHIYIYNNVITETNLPKTEEYYRGIAIKLAEEGVTGGHDILIANNTITGLPFNALMFTTNNFHHGALYNIQIVNNVFKDNARTNWGYNVMALGNGDGSITYGSIGAGTDVIVDYNATYSSSKIFSSRIDYNNNIEQTFSQFRINSGCQTHYVETDPLIDNNLKPLPSSPLIGKGLNLSTYFTIDKNGVIRPPTLPWNIGAFQDTVKKNTSKATRIRLLSCKNQNCKNQIYTLTGRTPYGKFNYYAKTIFILKNGLSIHEIANLMKN
jgi:hypothetical protein